MIESTTQTLKDELNALYELLELRDKRIAYLESKIKRLELDK